MNMFKKTGGFTLVELIVVIAILAILAGVAVPAYSGYIKKAQDATAITELDAIATAAQAANAEGGAISEIEITGAKAFTVTAATKLDDNFKANFEMFYAGSTVTMPASGNEASVALTDDAALEIAGTSYENGATWSGAEWTAAAASNG